MGGAFAVTAAQVLRTTLSPCRECRSLLAAELVEDRGGSVYLERVCPEHGAQRDYCWKGAADLRRALAVVRSPAAQPPWGTDLATFPYVRGVCIDLTTRCNLPCPTCFADANRSPNWEPTVDEIRARLRGFARSKPIVYLIGGEPTLRPDLADIVAALVADGFHPKLVTNGIKIADLEYLSTLHAAGLRWVFLQFDGFRRDTSIAYRSRDIRGYKDAAIANMTALGMNILLACMVEKGFNDDELGDIVRFAATHPRIRQVAFLPASDIGRKGLGDPEAETMMGDVFAALDRTTSGAIRGNDFLDMLEVNALAYRLTRRADFFPKTCFMSVAVHVDGEQLVPVNRMLRPATALRHPRTLLALLRHGWRLPAFERWRDKHNFLIVNIEKFRSGHNFDWLDAHSCSKVYLRREGWALSCMHNAYTRHDYRAMADAAMVPVDRVRPPGNPKRQAVA